MLQSLVSVTQNKLPVTYGNKKTIVIVSLFLSRYSVLHMYSPMTYLVIETRWHRQLFWRARVARAPPRIFFSNSAFTETSRYHSKDRNISNLTGFHCFYFNWCFILSYFLSNCLLYFLSWSHDQAKTTLIHTCVFKCARRLSSPKLQFLKFSYLSNTSDFVLEFSIESNDRIHKLISR